MSAQEGGDDPSAIDAEASVLMKNGIRRLNEASTEGTAAALECFNRALSLRRQLPIDDVPLFRYGLAACLLNRADALVRMDDADSLSPALAAYDEAISLLKGLRLEDDPRFPRRLAMAHQNRGVALQSWDIGDPSPIDAFSEALAVLEGPDAAAIADREYLRAAALVNLANAWVAVQTPDAERTAREAAAEAMRLVESAESEHPDAAEVGLKARHLVCQTVARHLSTTDADTRVLDGVHEATDAVDDGLRLVRFWEQKGVGRFRLVAADLFQFGAIVYGTFQPHFLEEFVQENLDPASAPAPYLESDEMRDAIARVKRALATGG